MRGGSGVSRIRRAARPSGRRSGLTAPPPPRLGRALVAAASSPLRHSPPTAHGLTCATEWKARFAAPIRLLRKLDEISALTFFCSLLSLCSLIQRRHDDDDDDSSASFCLQHTHTRSFLLQSPPPSLLPPLPPSPPPPWILCRDWATRRAPTPKSSSTSPWPDELVSADSAQRERRREGVGESALLEPAVALRNDRPLGLDGDGLHSRVCHSPLTAATLQLQLHSQRLCSVRLSIHCTLLVICACAAH